MRNKIAAPLPTAMMIFWVQLRERPGLTILESEVASLKKKIAIR